MTLAPLPDDPTGVRVLQAAGELDVVVAPTVLPAVPELVAGARGVVLDLAAVTFLDSSGVRLVDGLARACARAGSGFRVVAPPGSPGRRVLELVGMADGLVEDDLPGALAALS